MEHKEKTEKEDKKEHRKHRLPEKLNKHPHKRRPSELALINRETSKPRTRKQFSKIFVDHTPGLENDLDFVRSPSLVPHTAPLTSRKSAPLGYPRRKSNNRNSNLLPQIYERDDTKQYNFKGLTIHLNAQELERYKMKYFDSDSVWQRLLPRCYCEFCNNTSGTFDPLLKRVKTPYKMNGSIPDKALTIKKSFSLYSSNMDVTLNARDSALELNQSGSSSVGMPMDDDLKQQQSILVGCCAKEKTTPLITVMGLGMKNNKHHFMHMLNDINSKMILSSRLFLYVHQKSAPPVIPTLLNPISDEEPEQIERARTLGDMGATKPKHAAQQSVSSCSRDSSYSHDPILYSADSGSNSDQVPILKVRKLRKIKSLHAAIRTYHRRLAKPLDFRPQRYMIQDSVSEIVDIVKVMTHVVKCFAAGHSMPFQIDVVIVPKGVSDSSPKANKMDVVWSDDDDDDDDDDLHTDDEEDWKQEEESKQDDGCIISEEIGDMLTHGLLKNHHESFYKGCIPLIRSDSGIHLFKDYICNGGIDLFSGKNPMQNGRYVIIVDRREGNEKKSFPVIVPPTNPKKDQKDAVPKTEGYRDYMYFFQPPKPYGEIIDCTTMIETLHLNTLECLIPKINHKLKEEDNTTHKEAYIGAKHLCKDTQMMCVSFHVLSQNEIRCYLYIDQKYMRIHNWGDLEDILTDNYVDVDVTAPPYMNRRTKYKEFAFDTKDTIFDNYFRWAQNHQKPIRFKSKSVHNGAIAIHTSTLTADD